MIDVYAESVLPTRPSALLELALADFDQVRAMPGMTIDMGAWVSISSTTKKPCKACLAGTVMIGHFHEQVETHIKVNAANGGLYQMPTSLGISPADINALRALSDFAFGHVGRGINRLAQNDPNLSPITESQCVEFEFGYEFEYGARLLRPSNLDAWRARMDTVVDFLKERGL